MSTWGFPRYVPVAEKRAKARRKLEQLMKKRPDIRPVLLQGRLISHTWWGKAWTTNLERYADYSNRIGRGRDYVRHGAVLDLQIEHGIIRALVQGSRGSPYEVAIRIKALDKKAWKGIRETCEGKIESLSELLEGSFPKELGEIFTAKGRGLFPSPEEIQFECSCPDWAHMCKHVAATFYGTGSRLDEEPELLFRLRRVSVNDLITQAVEEKARKLLRSAKKKSSRILEQSDLSSVFGIELEEVLDREPKGVKSPERKLPQQKTAASVSKKLTTGKKQEPRPKAGSVQGGKKTPSQKGKTRPAKKKSAATKSKKGQTKKAESQTVPQTPKRAKRTTPGK